MNDGGAADTTINSYQNPNNFGRFRVLKDKDILVQDPNFTTEFEPGEEPPTGYARTNGLIRNFKFNINFKVLSKYSSTPPMAELYSTSSTTPSTLLLPALVCQLTTLPASATTRVSRSRSKTNKVSQTTKTSR